MICTPIAHSSLAKTWSAGVALWAIVGARRRRHNLASTLAARRVLLQPRVGSARIPPASLVEVFAMIYELRVYQPVPGRMAKLQARFRDQLLPIWEKHGIRPIGFWTTLIGKSSNELTYILAWDSLADRETRWTAFQNDPDWHKMRDDSERDGPIVASISNQILKPTDFSALK
jgi:hypothetical protein